MEPSQVLPVRIMPKIQMMFSACTPLSEVLEPFVLSFFNLASCSSLSFSCRRTL